MKYPANGFLRVALLPAISDLAAPTLTEIGAGVDITCDLTDTGLRLNKGTVTVDVTPWADSIVIERPTRSSISAGLQGYRFRPPEDEPLYEAAVFKARGFLVVRRGTDYDTAWVAGQVVETYDFRFGKRTPSDPAPDVMTVFDVPLFVSAEDDDAEIAA